MAQNQEIKDCVSVLVMIVKDVETFPTKDPIAQTMAAVGDAAGLMFPMITAIKEVKVAEVELLNLTPADKNDLLSFTAGLLGGVISNPLILGLATQFLNIALEILQLSKTAASLFGKK